MLVRKTMIALFLMVLSMLVLGCDPAPHRTPLDALTEPPGKVPPPYRDTIRVLSTQDLPDANGVILLYRWQTSTAQAEDTFCLASTFVTREQSRWQAQSTGYFVGTTLSQPACNLSHSTPLRASYYQAGQHTIVYGVSNKGNHIQVTWSDGMTMIAPIEQRVFLVLRPGNWHLDHVEIVDDQL